MVADDVGDAGPQLAHAPYGELPGEQALDPGVVRWIHVDEPAGQRRFADERVRSRPGDRYPLELGAGTEPLVREHRTGQFVAGNQPADVPVRVGERAQWPALA